MGTQKYSLRDTVPSLGSAIVFRTKNQSVYIQLKEAILSGEMEPGEPIILRSVAKRFGCSETPIREAIRRLETEGLVVTAPHIGVRVSLPSPKTLGDMLGVQLVLEAYATELCAENPPPELRGKLAAIIAEMASCVERNDYREYRRLNKQFHLTIYKSCGNEYLYGLLEDLIDKTERAHTVFKFVPTRLQSSSAEHVAIAEAVCSGDSAKAKNLVMRHKGSSFSAFLQYLKTIFDQSNHQDDMV